MSQNKSKLKVAIIGLGTIGKTLATNLTKGNRPLILADRELANAKNIAKELGNLAQPMDIPAAIKEADIIIMAVWFNVIKELLNIY
ncbi:MAG TPA: NAD(P)-binding domain-containing protein, partial [Chitinophagaceae bacterium]|nr:NAD(P)-binding domain-containing protein [Chitinophagaceae bacterium]